MTNAERTAFEALIARQDATEAQLKEIRETQFEMVEAINKMTLLSAVQLYSGGGVSWTRH